MVVIDREYHRHALKTEKHCHKNLEKVRDVLMNFDTTISNKHPIYKVQQCGERK